MARAVRGSFVTRLKIGKSESRLPNDARRPIANASAIGCPKQITAHT
jgi:hypothetical protein